MYTLGLNIYHADSSACLFKNGELLCAYEEERLNRIKHWSGIPYQSIDQCLKFANISIEKINFITVNSNPFSNLTTKFFSFFFSNNKYFHFLTFFKKHCRSAPW